MHIFASWVFLVVGFAFATTLLGAIIHWKEVLFVLGIVTVAGLFTRFINWFFGIKPCEHDPY